MFPSEEEFNSSETRDGAGDRKDPGERPASAPDGDVEAADAGERDAGEAPILVAIWPGMGSVAVDCGAFLASQFEIEKVAELPKDRFFDIDRVDVQSGIANTPWIPGCTLYRCETPAGEPPLLLFLAEAQPHRNGYELCHELLDIVNDIAQKHRVSRVFTFAATATQIHPKAEPRVFAVANHEMLLDALSEAELPILEEGQITGLNGVLLAAAAERELHAFCLLGEIPFFAVGTQNPKAVRSVLRAFNALTGIELDFSPLGEQIEAMEHQLNDLLERMNQAIQDSGGDPTSFSAEGFEGIVIDPAMFDPANANTGGDESAGTVPSRPIAPGLSDSQLSRIETLFTDAAEDRTKALELKGVLDELGVFDRYQDRFLDLFRSS